jgi:hypothetical protein
VPGCLLPDSPGPLGELRQLRPEVACGRLRSLGADVLTELAQRFHPLPSGLLRCPAPGRPCPPAQIPGPVAVRADVGQRDVLAAIGAAFQVGRSLVGLLRLG